MIKVHFIFTMLMISTIHVISRGKIVGTLTKNEFIELKQGRKIAI